jgi:hypothetical protein
MELHSGHPNTRFNLAVKVLKAKLEELRRLLQTAIKPITNLIKEAKAKSRDPLVK